MQAALDAALRDPRFEPVRAAELPRLEIEVTVLSPRRPSARGARSVLGTHGIVLEKGDRRRSSCPRSRPSRAGRSRRRSTALAEKAGLPPDGWQEGASFSVFTGQVFEERP